MHLPVSDCPLVPPFPGGHLPVPPCADPPVNPPAGLLDTLCHRHACTGGVEVTSAHVLCFCWTHGSLASLHPQHCCPGRNGVRSGERGWVMLEVCQGRQLWEVAQPRAVRLPSASEWEGGKAPGTWPRTNPEARGRRGTCPATTVNTVLSKSAPLTTTAGVKMWLNDGLHQCH